MRVALPMSAENSGEAAVGSTGTFAIAFSVFQLCTKFLASVLNVHNNLVSSVLKRPSALSVDLPGRHINSSSEGTFESSIVVFLHTLADELGDAMPSSAERHLPHKSKKLVYMLYCESKRRIQELFCTKSHFYRTWKNLVPQIKCRKSHTFAICETCVSFRDRLMHIAKISSRDREREALLNGFRTHLNNVKLERAVYAGNRLEAVEKPGEVLSVIIDGADESKFGIPRFLEKSKSESGHCVKQKLTGVLFHGGLGNEEFLTYLTSPDNLPGGANQTIDAFSRCFLLLLERREFNEKLGRPKTLYVQLENTSKDNKNRFVMAFCEWLVHHGIFESVHVNFLPVGHTHEDVDRKFSRVSVALSCQDTITVQDLHRVIRHSVLSHNKPHVARVRGYSNLSQAMENQNCIVKTIPQFTTYRKFVFQRDGAVDMRANVLSYFVSAHAAASMAVPKADWTKLEKQTGSIGSFLIRDIDLNDIPQTLYTKPSEHDLKQMRKRIYSLESRIRDRNKFNDLLQNIETLENDTVALPEWSLTQLLETPLALKDPIILSEDSESDDEQTYSVGNMVTVRHTKSNAATPFWVGSITRVNSAVKNSVEVSWFEIVPEKKLKSTQSESAQSEFYRRESCYTAKYRPRIGSNMDGFCDDISTKSVLVLFERLTTSNTLPIVVQKLTRQALDPFAEYESSSLNEERNNSLAKHGNCSDTEDDPFEEGVGETSSRLDLTSGHTAQKRAEISDNVENRKENVQSSTIISAGKSSSNSNQKHAKIVSQGRKRPASKENLKQGGKVAKKISSKYQIHGLQNGAFVAVNCSATPNCDPFWLGQVKDTRSKTSEKINVVWFSPVGEAQKWSFASYSASKFEITGDEDYIPVGSILVSFRKLTSTGKISKHDIVSLQRALEGN